MSPLTYREFKELCDRLESAPGLVRGVIVAHREHGGHMSDPTKFPNLHDLFEMPAVGARA